MQPKSQAYSDFQVKVLLERVLRRPLWQVKRDGLVYHVWTTAWENALSVQWRDLSESMSNGNLRPTAQLQKTLLDFQNTGIPDKDGRDISGRVSPPPEKKQKGVSSFIKSLFGRSQGGGNGAPGSDP